MLDIDEHGGPIRRQRNACNLTIHGARQETPEFPGGRIAGQHLVIPDILHFPLVHLRRVRIGLDPQHAAAVEGDEQLLSSIVEKSLAMRASPFYTIFINP
ncbi:MAG: hypothetical protein V7606_1962 [Burkholderiales bacterium]